MLSEASTLLAGLPLITTMSAFLPGAIEPIRSCLSKSRREPAPAHTFDAAAQA